MMISRRLHIGSLGCLLVVLTYAIPAYATTRHVPTAAYPTISAGLSAAVSGDDVLVDCGTYNEHALVMPSGVWLHSQSGQPQCVAIDAQGIDRVMSGSALGPTTKIEGITLTGGSVPLGGHGAGFLCNGGSPTIINCVFDDNIIVRGGGGGGASFMNATPTLSGCTFDNNRATVGAGVELIDTAGASFTDCVIRFNRNRQIEFQSEVPLGAGMYCVRGTGLALTRCVFYSNEASYPVQSGAGGAILIDDTPSAFVSNCTLVDNRAFSGGGMQVGLYYQTHQTHVDVMNTIVAFNSSYTSPPGESPGIQCASGSSAVLTCSDVFGNHGSPGGTWDWFGCLDGQLPLRGNLSADPLFCDFSAQDYRLNENSPCAPGHSPPGCGLIGALPVGCALAVEPATWGQIKSHYRSNK